jgi:hypothetical protein
MRLCRTPESLTSSHVDAVGTDVFDREDSETEITQRPTWHPLIRIAFRFCVVYLGLFCLLFAQITFAFTGFIGRWLPDEAILWQLVALDPVLRWVGRNVFGIDAALHLDSGSGDQAAIWVLVFCILVVAALATVMWTAVDRHRTAYPRLGAWFLVFLRLCLAGQMLFYGIAKVIPTQMPPPPLSALLRPYGEFSPMSVLWLQVGSSPPYQIALGAVEMVAGLLLFLPRTATLGALLSFASMAQVFLMNMTFDVPVKILSFHLLLMSLVLLAPQLRRLANVLVLQRPSEPATQPALFRSPQANQVAAVVQVALGGWILIGCVAGGWQAWQEYGGGRPKPALYGIWSVTEFTRDGVPVAPVTTDENRWQRLVFEEPGMVTYQRMDGALVPVPADVDADTIALPDAPSGRFAFDRSTPDRLRLTGELDGHAVTMSLERVDPNSFTLRNRGFHWVQEYPYFS